MVWGVPLASTKLIPRSLTPGLKVSGIRSLVGFGILVGTLAHSALYPQILALPRLTLELFRGEPAISSLD